MKNRTEPCPYGKKRTLNRELAALKWIFRLAAQRQEAYLESLESVGHGDKKATILDNHG